MSQAIPSSIDIRENQNVLAFLRGASAHSDTAQALRLSAKKLTEAEFFAPDPKQYSYVLIHANSRVFACARGMQSVYLKLPASFHADAIKQGAVPQPEIDDDWFALPLWRDVSFDQDLACWTHLAYEYAFENPAAA